MEIVNETVREETKGERFVRLAEFRVTRAIASISTIEALANTSNYDYTDDQAAELIKALDNAVGKLETTFSKSDRKATTTFSFKPEGGEVIA